MKTLPPNTQMCHHYSTTEPEIYPQYQFDAVPIQLSGTRLKIARDIRLDWGKSEGMGNKSRRGRWG